MRIDKWLFFVRIFKTRSQATKACQGNLVKIDNRSVKPSRELCSREVILIEKDIAVRKARVLEFPPRRISAKEAEKYREDLTAETPPRKKYDFLDEIQAGRGKGKGRPTKKERRQMEALSKHPGTPFHH